MIHAALRQKLEESSKKIVSNLMLDGIYYSLQYLKNNFRMGGRILVDIIGESAWTTYVNSCEHFFLIVIFVVVPFIFRILVRYETFITRAQGPVIVIAKEEI